MKKGLPFVVMKNRAKQHKRTVVYAVALFVALNLVTAQKALAGGVQQASVCFSVHLPTDGTPISVTGTLTRHGRMSASTPVLLMLHGSGGNRHQWDGGAAGPELAGSVVRRLARAGYVAIAIDRPAHGDSPFANGRSPGLSLPNVVLMEHEIVEQIHRGTYTILHDGDDELDDDDAPAACPGGTPARFGSPTVVLVGQSNGGNQAENYAMRFHDVAGVVAMGSENTTFGLSSTFRPVFEGCILPQLMAGSLFVHLFCPGVGGVSTDCLSVLFYLPGANPDVANAVCANSAAVAFAAPASEPQGDIRGLNRALIIGHQMGATPVLLAFADNDAFVPGPGNPFGDRDYRTAELNLWSQCGCDVTTYIQPSSGHFNTFHLSMPDLVDNIVSWLQTHNIIATHAAE